MCFNAPSWTNVHMYTYAHMHQMYVMIMYSYAWVYALPMACVRHGTDTSAIGYAQYWVVHLRAST